MVDNKHLPRAREPATGARVIVNEYVVSFDAVGLADIDRVGGKNASIGEMLRSLSQLGVRVPRGFATTARAYRDFLAQGGLATRINAVLASLDVNDLNALATSGARIRQWILETPFPPALQQAVLSQWREMDQGRGIAVAVRSSATAEDLPEASFAGQQETFLNVRGEAALLAAMHQVYASLFTDRAIYRPGQTLFWKVLVFKGAQFLPEHRNNLARFKRHNV